MFDYIKGTLTDKRKTARGTFFSVETSGIGYSLEVTEQDFINHSNSAFDKGMEFRSKRDLKLKLIDVINE